jgi:hypothetical protein
MTKPDLAFETLYNLNILEPMDDLKYNNNICTPIARQRVGKQVPRRHISGKQSVIRLRTNSDNRRNVFNVVHTIPIAKQQNCKHVCNNKCFVRGSVSKVYTGQ